MLRFIGISFVQAFMTGLFVWLWTIFMLNMDKFVATADKPAANSFLLVPIMFIIAAALSAGAVLGYPIYLVVAHRAWGRAVGLILLTLIWLGLLAAGLIYLY
jgi:hypothetical protein